MEHAPRTDRQRSSKAENAPVGVDSWRVGFALRLEIAFQQPVVEACFAGTITNSSDVFSCAKFLSSCWAVNGLANSWPPRRAGFYFTIGLIFPS